MARLTFAFFIVCLLLGGQLPQTGQDQQFRDAGVCARCHIVSVVEWGELALQLGIIVVSG